MKKFFFLFLFISLLGCEKNDNEKYFDSEKLGQLNLTDIDEFWNELSDIDTSYYTGFENSLGFIEGISLSSIGKDLSVSVFDTKEEAINAMEIRANTVSCIITDGESDEFKNRWWYSQCPDFTYMIFENHYNTIVQIRMSANASFDIVKVTLFDVAEEINNRIDDLSEKLE